MQRFFNCIEEYKVKSGTWFRERAHGTHARMWLVILAFSESSFFLIPPDILLVAILMAGARRWVYYATITTIAAVCGSIFGYVVGLLFFNTVGINIVEWYGLTDQMIEVGRIYDNNTFWVIFMAAFTPIPYKVFVLLAGFFKVNFFYFILASILGRGLRYFTVAYITKLFGEEMVRILFRYFNIITFTVASLLVLFLMW